MGAVSRLRRALAALCLVPTCVVGARADMTCLPIAGAGPVPQANQLEATLSRLEDEQGPGAWQAALTALLEVHKGRVTVETYGQSRAGHPLQALWIDPLESPAGVTTLPSIVMLPDLDQPGAPVALLARIESWLQGGGDVPHMRLCVLPVPNPDLLWQEQAAGDLERNFPCGWTWKGPGQGAPLCHGETRSLVAWFLRHSEVAAVLRVGPEELETARDASLTRYLRDVLGLSSVAWTPGGPVELQGALESAAQAGDRLQASVESVRRLGETLWCVDLKLHNGGPERFVGPAPGLEWQVSGGRVLHVARASRPGDDWELVGPGGSARLPGRGKSAWLRLVIDSTEAGNLFVRLSSPRCQAISLPLRAPAPAGD
ncbi:MAG: hypothetical protein R3F33_10405 [Planctomycetota bacterium]